MVSKPVRWLAGVILVWLVVAAVGPCRITHVFGPYYGRVVDAVSGEPIEGAVVWVGFHTTQMNPGGGTSYFVDALETKTDAQGTFHISAYRAWVFRFPHRWDEECMVRIFKPSYRVFPGRGASIEPYNPGGNIPEDTTVVVKLPLLKSREERLDNLMLPDVPDEKMELLRGLKSRERNSLGLK